MAIALPQIVYNPGSGNVTITFVDGPNDFVCEQQPRRNRNVATSGLVETVFEFVDLLIGFTMPALDAQSGTGPVSQWETFYAWASQGGTFEFYPNSALSTYYNCTMESEKFSLARKGPAKYSAPLQFRIVPDSHAPADAGEVYRRFYGISTP